MDLLERNYNVHVLADGVSSRTMVERMFALEVKKDRSVKTIFSIITSSDRGNRTTRCLSEMEISMSLPKIIYCSLWIGIGVVVAFYSLVTQARPEVFS